MSVWVMLSTAGSLREANRLGIPVAFPDEATYCDVLPGTFFYQYVEGATAAGVAAVVVAVIVVASA